MRRHVPCFPSGASGGPAHGHRRSPTMNSSILIVLIVVIVVAVAAVAIWLGTRRRRTAELREHYGPEYDRAVGEYGAPGPAERALSERSERVEKLHIRPLSAAD